MKKHAAILMCALLAGAASPAFAMDDAMTKKPDNMAKDGMMKDGMGKPMTMQECTDHMAMAKKDGMKKDDAMMKKDATCSAMMKKDGMKKDDAMMKPATPGADPKKY